MSLKTCANACNRSVDNNACYLIDKYFSCNHEQCLRTTSFIFYCIHCGCNEINDEIWSNNVAKYSVYTQIKSNKRKLNKISN